MSESTETKPTESVTVEITGDMALRLLERFHFKPVSFDCKCELISDENPSPIIAGDNVTIPLTVIGYYAFRRFYLRLTLEKQE